MHRVSSLSLPISEHLAFLDATLLFIIQVLLARHPELLASPDSAEPCISRHGLRPERRVFEAIRELNYALDFYRIPEDTLESSASLTTEDDILF